ncbi:MAG: HDOD domain-containing protein [Halieaceae bacterium]
MKPVVGKDIGSAPGAPDKKDRDGVHHVMAAAVTRRKPSVRAVAACSILFVEPQADNERCISNSLLGANADWQIVRTASAESALDIIQQRNISVIVYCLDDNKSTTDQCLRAVLEHNPGIIRLALVAHSDNSKASELPELAHQTLSADTSPEHLLTALERCTSAWQRLQGNPQLQSLLATVEQMPTPPAIYFRVREEIDAPHSDSESIAAIIARDAALAAKILRLVNSGFFALPFSVSDLHQAITMLGSEIVLSLALSAHLFERLPIPGVDLDTIWKHGFLVSALAKRIAQDEGGKLLDVNASSVAGLLHDIGVLVMMANFPHDYQAIIEEQTGVEDHSLVREHELFGVSHPELGGLILELWCLPDDIVDAVSNHHRTDDYAQLSIAARATMLAEWLVNAHTHGDGQVPAVDLPSGISHGQVAAWWDACEELANQALI